MAKIQMSASAEGQQTIPAMVDRLSTREFCGPAENNYWQPRTIIVLNHSNFVAPEPLTGASLFDATGAPLNNGFLATQPRDVQFALKIIW
jgi:hypothetical protein